MSVKIHLGCPTPTSFLIVLRYWWTCNVLVLNIHEILQLDCSTTKNQSIVWILLHLLLGKLSFVFIISLVSYSEEYFVFNMSCLSFVFCFGVVFFLNKRYRNEGNSSIMSYNSPENCDLQLFRKSWLTLKTFWLIQW